MTYTDLAKYLGWLAKVLIMYIKGSLTISLQKRNVSFAISGDDRKAAALCIALAFCTAIQNAMEGRDKHICPDASTSANSEKLLSSTLVAD